MSAVAGMFFLDGRGADRVGLERMVESLSHRGPDGSGQWNEGPVGLGHRMFRTTPESLHEALPWAGHAGEIVITADARIDNREELVAALDLGPLREAGDGELILRAYERWGEHCPERLVGDFAFALWDRRRQALFCARDPMGVKPFYYSLSGRAFAFASEIKALLCLPEVPRRLNEERVADYLLSSLQDKTATFYKDILRLPPAHSMTVSRGGSALRRYWSLDPDREIRYASDGEYAEAFREIFTEAVRGRLRSAFPVGSMLSGGLDSSSIACTARELLGKEGNLPLKTFSAIFDEVPECDERPFIHAVLSQGGIDPHFIHGDRLGPLADLDRVLWHQDEAFYAPNLFLHWGLYRAARDQGVRVLLDGVDGDVVVSHGIPHLAELAGSGRWIALAGEVLGLSRNFGRSPWAILKNHAVRPFLPEPVLRAWRLLRNGRKPLESADGIVNRDFARRLALTGRCREPEGGRSRPLRSSREGHYRGLTSGIIPFSLEVADKAAAAFSVEPRYPFFDRRLAEYCLALPPEQKIRRGWTRAVMRRAMADVLPTEIRRRGGKSNLGPNFVRGLLAFHRGHLENAVYGDSGTIGEYVDMAALRRAYRRCEAGGADGDALAVWKAVTLALWLHRTGLTPGNN